jgi:AcrR family transcriptional regulator
MSASHLAEPLAGWPSEREAGKSRRAKALPLEERREAIVEATLPLLIEHGLAVTTRQIATAAGIAEGTIFRAFPDKEALIDAVVQRALDPAPLEARLAEIDPASPLEERLLEAVQVLSERVITVWRLVTHGGFQRSPQEPDNRQAFTDLHPLVALFEGGDDRLRFDPEACARRFRALAIAMSHPKLNNDQPLTAQEIVSMFLDGARRPADRLSAQQT